MSGMFLNCYKLRQIIGINNFNTANDTTMLSMFQLCKELEYIYLNNFDTSNATDMKFMFSSCYKLK